jgi:urea transport system substrate-binding protein
LDYAFQTGKKKVFLLGSDYVFPRTANLILKKHILKNGGVVSGEEYVPLGGTDFSAIITKIKIAMPDVVFSTVNGDSNVSFFKQLAAAGITQQQLPIFSFSIAEQEAKAMGTSLVAGGFTAWNYFESLSNPKNKAFIAAYKAKYGSDAVLDDPMVHGYIDVLIWAAAVKKAGTFEPNAVRKAATQLASEPSPLGEIKFAANQSLVQTAYVGQFLPDGQVKVVWQSKGTVHPDPYDALAFPGKTCVVK